MKISIILYKSEVLADGFRLLMVSIIQLRSAFLTEFSCPASLWDFDKHTPKISQRDLIENYSKPSLLKIKLLIIHNF